MTPLLQSASFFLVRSVTVLFERFKLIPSSVSSSFHRAFQAHSIRRSKPIPSWHIEERFKLILSGVPSLFLLDIWCHWSRLTIGSCLLHACSRACSVRAIEAGSLSGDGLGDEVNIGRAFEAGSLSLRAYYTHVVGLVLFDDGLNQEVNCCLLVRACYTHVAGLVPFVPTTRM